MSEENTTQAVENAAQEAVQPSNYNAANIQVLEGMEAVRKRPAMYIGDTGERGYHHLVYEVVDNSIDEALAGYCTNIDVLINADGSLTVQDNGRGIPVDMHPTQGKPAIEVVLTVLHAGGKFDGSNYKVSGGLHGVGVSCVNALSDWMKVEVKRGGKIHHIEFSRGHVTKPLEVVGECGEETGTKVTFFPDHTIFSCRAFKWEILCARLRELAFLNKGVKIHFRDDEGEEHHEETFHFEGGIDQFIEYLNTNKKALSPVIHFEGEKANTSGVPIAAEVSMQYTETFSTIEQTYCNNIHTIEGGTHLSGFRAALTRTINKYGADSKLIKEKDKLTGDDMREGLTVIVSVKVPQPQFEGQTKTKLGNGEVEGIVAAIVSDKLMTFFEENPAVGNSLSKAHNMAGWRIGMVAADADVISEILKVKSQMDSGMFKPLQLAAVQALSQGPEWFAELNAEYRRRRVLAGEIFDLLGVEYDHDSSGMFLWGRISEPVGSIAPNVGQQTSVGERVSDMLLREAGVFITPGFIFGKNGENYIRISLCAKPEVLRKAADRIKCGRQSAEFQSIS